MIYVVESGNGDIIDRMWRLMRSARRNQDEPYLWRLTDEILESVQAFYGLCVAEDERRKRDADAIHRFLDIPVDPTTTMPHLLCRPDVVYHL